MNPRLLLAGTALATIATPFLAAKLSAQVVIGTARTTPVVTSTIADGQPSDVRIESAGSVTVGSGTAVMVDSNNSVTNAGGITISNADNATGILVSGARTANVTNSGTITLDENFTPTDSDNDGDIDGPFATGTGRTAILIGGALTGNLSHTGTIVVEGNNSAGIRAAAPITGAVTIEGKTTVTGNNTVGVALAGASGNVRLAGEITVRGSGAQGAVLSGDYGGALRVQSAITATGYRTVTPPADTSKFDADDLLQGGSALVIEGNAARGIIFEIAPSDTSATDPDEDKDGIEDAKEGNARILAYGAAPAVQIGGASAIAIGATQGTSNGFGIVMAGTIYGDGVYQGVNGTGMRIGGRGGAVTIAGGIQINGQIGGASRGGNATALELAAGTATPELRNAGTLAAAVTGTTGTGQATAVLVGSGASLPGLRNSRTIAAGTIKDGSAYGIRDLSGTLGLIENAGAISATGAEAGSGRNVAIDLSVRTGDSIVRQTLAAAGVPAPSIEGDIRFGSGNDLLELLDGGLAGDVFFGGGTNRLVMSGDAVMVGNADFGGGAGTLSLGGTSAFGGKLLNAQNVAVSLGGGTTFAVTGAATIASLDTGTNSVIGATLGGPAGSSTAITVTGAATFGTGTKIRVRLADLNTAVGTHTVIAAGSLAGANNLSADSALVPFLFKAALAVSGNNVNIAITRKATAELGLNASEAAAFDPLFAALSKDTKVADVFLGISSTEVLQAYVAQTLPDHAGGSFYGLSQGLRAFDRHFMDQNTPFEDDGKFRIIADFANWNLDKDRGQSAAFDLSGIGFRAGVEYLTGIGAFGVTGSWLSNKHNSGPFENTVRGTSYEAGAHWRGKFGPVLAFARAGAGKADFEGSRRFTGAGTNAANYTIVRDGKGDFISAAGGISLEGGGQFFFFRPSVVVDYLRLKEDGYTETGGGTALNLTVDARSSKEVGVNGGLAVGADLFGMQARDSGWLRIEGEGGWRELLTSDLGATRVRYNTGAQFTLDPEGAGSGWFARARMLGGDSNYKIAGEVGLEEQFGNIGYSLRASIRLGW